MADCQLVRVIFVFLFFFKSVNCCLVFLLSPIVAMLKHGANLLMLTQLVSSRQEEEWLRIRFATQLT